MTDWAKDHLKLSRNVRRWGVVLPFALPFLLLIPSFFVGAHILKALFGPEFTRVGIVLGGLSGWLGSVWITYRKLGFLYESALECPDCRVSVAKWTLAAYHCDDICRQCGHRHAEVARRSLNNEGEVS